MKEEKLQSEVARLHSERFPHKRGQLFHVSNERSNKTRAYQAIAIGIVPGVADFIYFSNKKNVATELKVSGSRHTVHSIKRQLEWGKLWESKGNIWRLCTEAEDALSCYQHNYKGMTTKEVETLLEGVKTKTIKIP